MKIVTLGRSTLLSVLLASFVAPTLVACGGTRGDDAVENESALMAIAVDASVAPVCYHYEWQDGEFKHEQPLDPASNAEIQAALNDGTPTPPGYPGYPGGGGSLPPRGSMRVDESAIDFSGDVTPIDVSSSSVEGSGGVDAQYLWVLKWLWIGGKYGAKYGPSITKFATNFFTGYKYFKLAGQAGRLAIRARSLGLHAAKKRFIVYAAKKAGLGLLELGTGITVAKEVYEKLAKDIADARGRGECVDDDQKTLEALGARIKEAEQHEKTLKELIDILNKTDTGGAAEAPEPPARNPGESDDDYDRRLLKWLREVEDGK